MTSMRRNDVASTSIRRHVPTRFLINQCQIIAFLILKSDIIENSRIELRGIFLPVPSNQIKVTFIIILPFNLVHLWFFPVSHRNWRKRRVDYWGGGGGAKGYVGPPPKLLGGGPGPPWPPSSYAYEGRSNLADLTFLIWVTTNRNYIDIFVVTQKPRPERPLMILIFFLVYRNFIPPHEVNIRMQLQL